MFGFVFLINMPWVPLLVGFGSMCHLDRWRNVEGHSEGIFLGKERRIDCVSRSEVWMSIVAPGLKSGEEVGERLLSCPEQRKLRELVGGGVRAEMIKPRLSFLSFPHVSHIPIGPPISDPLAFTIPSSPLPHHISGHHHLRSSSWLLDITGKNYSLFMHALSSILQTSL